MTTTDPAFLEEGPRRLAYRRLRGASPTLVFLPGFASSMEGTKAMVLADFAERRGQGLLRFDYSGTGSSPGKFEEGSIGAWLEDSLAVIDAVTDGPLVVIGSSMGAWIGLHLARVRPDRVMAFVGLAPAPDFTDWGFTDEQRKTAWGHMPHFVKSADEHALLREEIAVDCPVRLIHGDRDTEVPHDISLRIMKRLRSADVQLTLIKGGTHRLTEPHEIATILETVSSFLEPSA